MRPFNQALAVQALVGVKKALVGIRWFLDCGTLLGAVRDGDIILWDFDIDTGALAEDRGKIEEVAIKLRNLGFSATVFQEWKKNKDAKFIQFGYKGIPGHISFHWLKGRRPAHIEQLLEKQAPTRNIRGIAFPVPFNPENYLERMYKNWRVVDKNEHAYKGQIKEMVKKHG